MVKITVCYRYQGDVTTVHRVVAGITVLLAIAVSLLHYTDCGYWGILYGISLLVGAICLFVSTYVENSFLYSIYKYIAAINVAGLLILVTRMIVNVCEAYDVNESIPEDTRERNKLIGPIVVFCSISSVIVLSALLIIGAYKRQRLLFLPFLTGNVIVIGIYMVGLGCYLYTAICVFAGIGDENFYGIATGMEKQSIPLVIIALFLALTFAVWSELAVFEAYKSLDPKIKDEELSEDSEVFEQETCNDNIYI
ncbi:unnamed protein product [Bursaphelenchus xylophilus]|uniref:(pine wood nematode) hypothetical protein n=1 Tax=Bursaphelenchus xylophilus TaxID=6326 RepID=A0A811KZC8_BURXY|nr:unnamed protein product [Bursaphelenchus xylophilus]CAG9109156.1 unnamed protein product [Bursaphelenchus xylophilus]